MPDQTPVQIAWVTRDLDATEALTVRAAGRQEVGPDARRALRPGHLHLPRAAGRLRRRHLAELCRRHATRADRPGHAATASTPSSSTGPAPGCTTSAWPPTTPGFDAAVAAAERDGAAVVMAGHHAGGMRFAYVSAERPACPTSRSLTYPHEIHAFFDHMKQEQK